MHEVLSQFCNPQYLDPLHIKWVTRLHIEWKYETNSLPQIVTSIDISPALNSSSTTSKAPAPDIATASWSDVPPIGVDQLTSTHPVSGIVAVSPGTLSVDAWIGAFDRYIPNLFGLAPALSNCCAIPTWISRLKHRFGNISLIPLSA